jgi:hypothetical protein
MDLLNSLVTGDGVFRRKRMVNVTPHSFIHSHPAKNERLFL